MEQIEQLYYALGELCYAIDKADRKIEKEEKDKLHRILVTEFKDHESLINPAEIVFHILQKESMDSKTAYEWALHELKLNSQYLSEKLKAHFRSVIAKVAEAFPAVTGEGNALVSDAINQLNAIQGDPVFSRLTE